MALRWTKWPTPASAAAVAALAVPRRLTESKVCLPPLDDDRGEVHHGVASGEGVGEAGAGDEVGGGDAHIGPGDAALADSAGHKDHLVAAAVEQPGDVGADESGAAGDGDAHRGASIFDRRRST